MASVTRLFTIVILATIFHSLSATGLDSTSSTTISSTSSDGSDFTTHPNFKLLPTLDKCGYRFLNNNTHLKRNRHKRVKRITQGVPVYPGSMPWMVQIFKSDVVFQELSFRCGGSLINDNTVLTAAHCVTKTTPGYAMTDVVLGAYYLEDYQKNNYSTKRVNYTFKGFNYSAEIFLVEIESIKIHENYTRRNSKNDIALIKLKQNISSLLKTTENGDGPLTVTRTSDSGVIDSITVEIVRPICLPRSYNILQGLVGQNFQVAGWGTIGYKNGIQSHSIEATQLNKINSVLQPLNYCQDFYGSTFGPLDNTTIGWSHFSFSGENISDKNVPFHSLEISADFGK